MPSWEMILNVEMGVGVEEGAGREMPWLLPSPCFSFSFHGLAFAEPTGSQLT